MRGKDSAGLFPRGTSGREPVLNHPLGEGLGNDWGSVMKTQYRFGFGDIRRADGRSVTIDQRAWAGVTIEEVLEQFAVACVTLYAFDIVFENALQHLAVGRHVVAAEQRQWLQAQLLALVNGPGKDAYGRAGIVWRIEIEADIGMVDIQQVVFGIVVITTVCDG